jgi:hypothetical protein
MWLFSDLDRWSRIERVFAGLVAALLILLVGLCIH